MIDLKVDGKPIATYPDQSISIERTSPVLNDDAGSFSYTFAIPTPKNQAALGFPGVLPRSNSLSGQEFTLGDKGIMVARGEIGYNEKITKKNIPLFLKSGNSEFFGRMKGKVLSDLEYGNETFPAAYTPHTVPSTNSEREACEAEFSALLTKWTNANVTYNDKYRCFPFMVAGDDEGNESWVNCLDKTSALDYSSYTGNSKRFCLQFKIGFVLEKIFESAGYEIVKNEFAESEFADAVICGKIMRIRAQFYLSGTDTWARVLRSPDLNGTLEYAKLMPGIDVGDFVLAMEGLFCMTCHFNDITRKVSIKFNKNIFQAPRRVSLDGSTVDWEHGELEDYEGFTLKFQDQEDDDASTDDYDIAETVNSYDDLPEIDQEDNDNEDNEGLVYHVTDTDRDYKFWKDDDTWIYQRIGRLKPYSEGDGKNEFKIEATVPYQVKRAITFCQQFNTYTGSVTDQDVELPYLGITLDKSSNFMDIGLYITFFRHMKNITANGTLIHWPYASFDRYSLDGDNDMTPNLLPAYLYEQLHSEFINWQTYRKKPATKYIELSLLKVVALQWDIQYIIEGVPILLDKINFDLVYNGLVELNGYTI